MTIDRDKLRELASRATPGPWQASVDLFADDEDIRAVVDTPNVDLMFSCGTDVMPHRGGDSPSNPWTADDSRKRDEQYAKARESQAMRDAAFIAAARTAVPALLDQLEAVESERDGLARRRDELLVTIKNLSLSTPYPEEAGNAATLIAEVVTLKARVAEVERERDAANLTIESITAPHCEGCGAEVDPTTCWCGSECDGRDGHPFVEMGCNCMRDKNSEDWQRIATNLRVLAWHRKQALAASQQETERLRALLGEAVPHLMQHDPMAIPDGWKTADAFYELRDRIAKEGDVEP